MTQTFDDLHPRAAAGTFTDKPQSAPQVVISAREIVKLNLDDTVLNDAEKRTLREHLSGTVTPDASGLDDGDTMAHYYGRRQYTEKFYGAGSDGLTWYLVSEDGPIRVPSTLAKAAQLPDTTVVEDEPEPSDETPARSFVAQQQHVRRLHEILQNAVSVQENWNEMMGKRSGDLLVNRARSAHLEAQHDFDKQRLQSSIEQVRQTEEFYARGYDEHNERFTPLQLEMRDPELAALHAAVVRARTRLDESAAALTAWTADADQRRAEGVE